MTNLDKLQRVEASLVRWHRRLSRAATAIKKLDAQRRRLLVKRAEPVKALPAPKPLAIEAPKPVALPALKTPPTVELTAGSEDIPAFLRRSSPVDAVAQGMLDEQADLKKRKARGRIAKLKATQAGETKKMPLTGKAALAAIRGEA
jgi:hypothetical protein